MQSGRKETLVMTLMSRLWCSGSQVCCSVLQCVVVCIWPWSRDYGARAVRCVVVCCSVLQYVALCRSTLQNMLQYAAVCTWLQSRYFGDGDHYVAVCCSMLQYAAAYCSMLQCVYDTEVDTLVHAIHQSTLETKVLGQLGMLQCMLQNVAVGRSMLQYVAVCFSLGMTPKSILWCLQSTWAHSRLRSSCSQVCCSVRCSVCCSMLQYVAVCFSLCMTPKSILWCSQSTWAHSRMWCSGSQVCWSVWQYVVVFCSMLQYVAVYVWHRIWSYIACIPL